MFTASATTTMASAAARAAAAPASTSSSSSSRGAALLRGCSSKGAAFHTGGKNAAAFKALSSAPVRAISQSRTRNNNNALRVCAGGVDPESLAILQQRLGQRIQLEGDGAERLNQTAGQLLVR